MSVTSPQNRRQKNSLLNKARWAGYAAAGAATVLGAHESAEAGIVYSGVLNEKVDASISTDRGYDSFMLDVDGDTKVKMVHWGSLRNGAKVGDAVANFNFTNGGQIAGFKANGFSYAYNFKFGDFFSTKPFQAKGTMAYFNGYGNDRFLEPGIGFVGFSFDADADEGKHYGWLQVNMAGAPHNAFTIIDYAYAGVGETIYAGQVPEPGSLGLLAAGAIGLLLWRGKRRSDKPGA